MFAKRVFIISIGFLSCTTTSKKDDATGIRDLIDPQTPFIAQQRHPVT